MKSPGGITCSAKMCKNKSYNSNVSFFRFPKDLNRTSIWLKACGREDLLDRNVYIYRICSAHFKENSYTSKDRNRLLPSAVPTMSLNGDILDNDNNFLKIQECGPLNPRNMNIDVKEEILAPSDCVSYPDNEEMFENLKDKIEDLDMAEQFTDKN